MAARVTNTAKGRLRQLVDAAIVNMTANSNTTFASGTTAWSTTAAGNPGLLIVLATGTLTSGTDTDAASLGTSGTGLFTTATTGLTECVTSGYKNQLLTSVTSTTSNSTDDWLAGCANVVWGGASAIAAGTAITQACIAFVPCVGSTLTTNSGNTGQSITLGSNSASTAANCIPLVISDFAITPDGNDFSATIANFLRSV